MKISYSLHAKKRLAERKISKIDVRQTISLPGKLLLGDRNRIVVSKKLEHKILEVIYTQEGRKIIIVTAYHL